MKKTSTSPKNETPKFANMAEMLAAAEKITGTNYFPRLKNPSFPSLTIDDLKKDLRDYKAAADRLAVPFSPYQQDLSNANPKPIRWLWRDRLPLSGITLLDGDHACGKSLLALQIAAAVSSGSPMPDGTPTIQSGVVLVTPATEANSQIRLLTALGADLSRIHILSFLQDPAPEPHTGGYHPFTLPEDLISLFVTIKRVNARLVILDPFIHLLSRKMRTTNERLCHLLIDLNQRLIERNVACLLIRHCGAKGRHAKPSALEQSDHFASIAVSRLLLAPDPMQPDRFLLSHVQSRHVELTPTLVLQIQRPSYHSGLPFFNLLGSHDLQARDLLENRPDALHRRLLSQLLLRLITEANRPLPVTTLYEYCPHSSPFQIQRSLADLLRISQIQRPARGLYALTTTNELNATGATSPEAPPTNKINEPAAISPEAPPTNELSTTGATSPDAVPTKELNEPAAISPEAPPTNELNTTGATALFPAPGAEPEREYAYV